MKIIFYEIKEPEKEYFSQKLEGHELIFFEDEINDKNSDALIDADIISVFIYSKVNSDIIDKAKNLKLITTRSTGFDHIDLDACKVRGINVATVPSYGDNTVAEHTFALLLNLSRNVHKSYLRTLNNNYSIDSLQGFDLKAKTLGVIGTGRIGLRVIKIAKGFNMKVIAFDPYPNYLESDLLNFDYVSFEELLSRSDIITLHVPYNKSTHHLIQNKSIKMMKEGVIILNTSRGSIINTDDLKKFFDEGKIGGLGLDVIEGEENLSEKHDFKNEKDCAKCQQIMRDHELFGKDNVIFTPHNAFNSKEAVQRINDTTTNNIISFIDKKPINILKIS